MRHRVAHRKLNRTSSHRLAMRRSLVANLIEHESIITTLPKAKEVKPFAEKLITLAGRDTVTARRRAIALLNERRIVDGQDQNDTTIDKLFKVLGPRFVDRPGGYTRIVRLAGRRLGDGSAKVVLQFVDQALASTGLRRRHLTKSAPSKDSPAKADTGKSEAATDKSAGKSQTASESSRMDESVSPTKESDTAQAQT